MQEERKSNNRDDANIMRKSPSSSALEEGKEEQQNISLNASTEIQDEMHEYETKINSGQIPQEGDSTRSDE